MKCKLRMRPSCPVHRGYKSMHMGPGLYHSLSSTLCPRKCRWLLHNPMAPTPGQRIRRTGLRRWHWHQPLGPRGKPSARSRSSRSALLSHLETPRAWPGSCTASLAQPEAQPSRNRSAHLAPWESPQRSKCFRCPRCSLSQPPWWCQASRPILG